MAVRNTNERERVDESLEPEAQCGDAGEYARSLIEVSLDPLVTISPGGKITDVNEATVKVTGRERHELIGTDFSDYFTDPESARRGYREAFDNGSVTDYPLTIRSRNGRLTDVLYNASVYRSKEGEVLGVFAAARDITARRQAEEAAHRASRYNRSLIEASVDPLVTIDADGKITDANTATENATGFSREQLIGTDFSDYFTDPERARAGYQQVFRDGTVHDYELEISHKDGHATPVLYTATLYRDEEGEVAGIFAAARDISRRRQAEAAARAERKRLDDVLEMMPVYTILLSRDHHVVFANRFFEERFGECGGRRCFEYLFGRTEPCEVCRTYDVFQIDGPLKWEWTGPDGRVYDILDFPFTDSDGSSLIMEVGIDITERKRAEDELREYQRTLEARVEERTDELARANALLQAEVEERTKAEREKNRLYETQRRIAEQLQLAMLDIPDDVGRLRIGHLYRSATEAARVGGDFYDVFELGKGNIALLIGDVAGHGIEAARAATLAKDVAYAFMHQTPQPQKVLSRTNRLLLEKSMPGFVTLFLGILDTRTGRLRYSSAGHPEALLRRASGEVQALGSGSSPLGVFSDASWTTSETRLDTGDLLLLYTDGVIEARMDGDFFGQERLGALLGQQIAPVEQLPELILDRVLGFCGGSLRDDVAMLSLSLSG